MGIRSYTPESVRAYRRAFKNYFSVLLKVYRLHFPIYAKLRNGSSVQAETYNDLILAAYSSVVNRKVRLAYDNYHCGDLGIVFLKEDYSFLRTTKHSVVDVGANIGDSSVYFAIEGAPRVIAIEPFPDTFDFLVKNININGLNNVITPVNAMVGNTNKSTKIKIDRNMGFTDPEAIESEDGYPIRMMTLTELVNQFNIHDGHLKFDCEGCEQGAVLGTSAEILRRFSRIQIEYHAGYSDLVSKLEDSGFRVWLNAPSKITRILSHTDKNRLGYIYAERM